MLLSVDLIYYYTNHLVDAIRMARYFRPCLLMVYNKELRRTVKSILLSMQQIIQLILFFIIMNIFWALVAVKVIGNLDGEYEYNEFSQNYENVLSATSILYALSSPDIYPDCMLPALEASPFYLIYFLSYIILF